MGGGIQKRIYLVEHQSRLETSEKHQRITQDTGGWIAHPDTEHWLGNHSASTSTPTTANYGVWNGGFSQSSSSDRLTDEQREDLIAENIYDWWISGKSYKKWYADKFLQTKFEFE